MSKPQDIRREVSSTYAKVITRQRSSSSCCGGERRPKGVAAQTAGYTQKEIAGLPEDAVVNSFGCGNPLAFSKVKEGEVVVDLGSGAGIDVLLATQKVGPTGRVIGIDMTDEMIVKAEENIRRSGYLNAEIRKGMIEELPLDSSSVDWVISNCVINLSPEKPRVFREIGRVLRPGGRMLVSDIMVKDLPEWILSNQLFYSSCVSGAISEEAYLKGLQEAGLVKVKVTERYVYEGSQLEAFLGSELSDAKKINEFMKSVGGPTQLKEAIQAVEGKIWSAKVYAEKPKGPK